MRSLAIVALLCGAALADGTPLAVTVGATVKQDVGYARGVRCDDVSIVNVEMSTDEARDTNVLTVTGLEVGRTLCRAGLESNHVTYLFEIEVTAAKPAKPKPKTKTKTN